MPPSSPSIRLVAAVAPLALVGLALVASPRELAAGGVIGTVNPSTIWVFRGLYPGANLGASVATAGDVNGDGYSDVIVGEPNYNVGFESQGRAYVYLGGPSGFSLVWQALGGAHDAQFGACVAPAGDVNRDGYGDIIVGAPGHPGLVPGGGGAAFLYYGSRSGPSDSPSRVLEGDQVGDRFGALVATAGDVNGDGYADVVIGAPNRDGGGTPGSGAFFVYHGSGNGVDATADFSELPFTTNLHLATSAATAGDVNGDGFGDLIVGFPSDTTTVGGAWIYRGTAAGLTSAGRISLPNTGQTGALFGTSVAPAGDVNGDGYADVVVGAPRYDAAVGADAGYAAVFAGTSAGVNLTPIWTREGLDAGGRMGTVVGPGGDFNGDGYADVLVSSPAYDAGDSEGLVQVFTKVGLPGSASDNGFVYFGGEAGMGFGASAATAGDVNGDGFGDVIIGAPTYSSSIPGRGLFALWFGRGALPATTANTVVEHDVGAARFGRTLAAGDIDGDGFDDLAIGAPEQSSPEFREGSLTTLLGDVGGIPSVGGVTIESNVVSGHMTTALANAGDVNGDGFVDILAGVPNLSGDFTFEGSAYLYFGSATGLDVATRWSRDGSHNNAFFGSSAAGIGDVNGDGYADFIVGAPQWDTITLQRAGLAYVFHGGPTPLSATPADTIVGAHADDQWGFSVAGAGDVNRDGYSDVLIGSPFYSNGQFQEGAFALHLGSPTGLAASPAMFVEGAVDSLQLGWALATAGDVNHDGFSDFVVGAPGYSQTFSKQGEIRIYYGSSTFPLATDAAHRVGGSAEAGNGRALASAGDVNGDGYSDVIAGAPFEDGVNLNDAGAARIYLGGATGLFGASNWFKRGAAPDEHFGTGVAGAADFNADGFGDVAIGAENVSNGQSSEGAAYVFLGNGGFGLNRQRRQLQNGANVVIGPLGLSNMSDRFRLSWLSRSAAGRVRVGSLIEAEEMHVNFPEPGGPTISNILTGAPNASGSVINQGFTKTGHPTLSLYWLPYPNPLSKS